MPRYSSAAFLDGGLDYAIANCNAVLLTDSYQSTYAGANGAAKVASCALVGGDFAKSGADGAARVLTATLTGKSMGNALKSVADGTNMHLVFVKTGTSEVIWVTEESSNQAITNGNPVTANSNPTYTSGQPTA